MSLFQVHEWWRSFHVEPEECGSGCLCVANIDNATDGIDKIVVGSYNGILHIYTPQNSNNGKSGLASSSYTCLLEVSLQYPILQLTAGRFMSISTDITLAVLHPRLLSVYQFVKTTGGSDQMTECKKQLLYQHKLERSAVNMTWGQFGGVKDRDFMCVQSLDGTLSFFEQETFAFTRFLPGFLLPGPLSYNKHLDSCLTVSSKYMLESYSYQVLAVASDVKQGSESQTISKGKRIEVLPDELIKTSRADNKAQENIVESGNTVDIAAMKDMMPMLSHVRERSLFCFESSGTLLFMRRFEEALACFKTCPAPDGHSLQSIVCTHSRQILVFSNAKLKWAARIDDVPIIVETGTFLGVKGMLVFLNDQCQVSCHYLGTAPTVFALPRSQNRDMTHDRIDAELVQIKKKIIDQHASAGDNLSSQNTKEDLKIVVVVPTVLDKTSVSVQHLKSTVDEFPSITVQVSLKVNRRITDVQVVIPRNKPIYTSLHNMSLPSISEYEHPPALRISFFLESRDLPSSLNQSIFVTFKQAAGNPQVMTSEMRLPFLLVASGGSPVKKLDHRVTLDTDKPCLNLLELFPDLVCDESGPSCIGIDYRNGYKGTILTSKTSNRYRIQCDAHDGLWLITDELVHRLHQKNPDIRVSSQEAPPLEDFVQIVDRHFRLRQEESEIRSLLEHRAHQYRVIQRRLLTRFKDKTPQPLNCLDTLLAGTHTQLLALADAIEENNAILRLHCIKLSSACRLLVLLVKLWLELSEEETDYLISVLSVDHTYNGSNAVGWEETVDSSLTVLLKTNLAKGEGEQHFTPPNNSLNTPQDTVKIKKHLAILLDRLGRGGKLLPTSNRHPPPRKEPPKQERKQSQISIPDNAMDFLPPEGDVRLPDMNPPESSTYHNNADDISEEVAQPLVDSLPRHSSRDEYAISNDLETSYDDDYRDIFADD